LRRRLGPFESAKIGQLYADLGKLNCGTTLCLAGTDISYYANILRGGLNYHFLARNGTRQQRSPGRESGAFLFAPGTSA
jgi:hypothetical protein